MNFRQKLLYCIGREHYAGLAAIYVMMLVLAALEVLCAMLFLPFLTLVEDASKLGEYPWLESLLAMFDRQGHQAAIMACCILLLLAYIIKNTFNLVYQYYQASFIQSAQARLATKLLGKYLLSDYIAHVSRSSGELIRNINQDVYSIYTNVIRSLLQVMVEGVIATAMLGLLLSRNVNITLLAIVIFGTIGTVIYRISQRYTYAYGQTFRHEMGEMIKWTMQSLGSIKETKVMNKEHYFLTQFWDHVDLFKQSAVKYKVLYETPRLSIEVLGIFTVLLMTLVLLNQSDGEEALATLGLFAVVAFRILPSLARIASGLSLIRFHRPALDNVVGDLTDEEFSIDQDHLAALEAQREQRGHEKLATPSPISFEDRIEFDNIAFAYNVGAPRVIDGCSLTIERGSSVAFVGASGAGKTTLIDLLLGLLSPQDGEIRVDGEPIHGQEKRWQSQIGYISQPVYMLNDTIRRNVAFGEFDADVDEEKVWESLRKAQLEEVVRGLPEGLDTSIGEGGAKLSGGQRQRLGIARVLYHDPEVLVFDEATSALDNETEAEITKAIEALSLEKTIVLIAHRFSTIEHCDEIFMLADGKVLASGSFEELMQTCQPFHKLATASVGNSAPPPADPPQDTVPGS